jgi:poly(3-hydroxybutyrate) depolymerase
MRIPKIVLPKSDSPKRELRFLLYPSIVLACMIGLQGSMAISQDLRYELGARLRLFERDFESLETNDQQALALPNLSNCVQLFFGMQLKKAAEELDAARVAIQPESIQSILQRSRNMGLAIPGKLLDPADRRVQCKIQPLYGDADWSGLVGHWRILQWESEQEEAPPVASGQVSFPENASNQSVNSVDFDLDISNLAPGDYILELAVGNATEAGAAEAEAAVAGADAGSGRADGGREETAAEVVVVRRGLSVAPEARQRVAKLTQAVGELDAQLNATQLATLKGNVRQLERIVEDRSLETDLPAARLLDQTEHAVERITAGSAAYGAKQSGEFWIVAATSAGEKWLRVQAPSSVETGKPLPLVIALHGAGGSENMFFDGYGDGKIRRLADSRQWLLVAPRLGFGFGGLKLDELIEEIDGLYPVDRKSVFVVGHSMGAGAAVAMTAAAQIKPSAVAALGGGRGVQDASSFQGIPFFVAAGSHDFGRPGAKQLAESLGDGGVTVDYRDYPNIEHLAIVQVALEDVFAFFDSQCLESDRIGSANAQTELRIDQLQLLGTHNSYHLVPDKVAMQMIAAVAPNEAKTLDNSQRPLREQFEKLGVRHVELDLFLDPEGKLFFQPFAYQQAQRQGAEVPDFDPDQKMTQPGIKVLHSPDVDYRTSVYTLIDALSEIKDWSDGNQRHIPIFVLLELKSQSFSPMTRPLPWTLEAFQELEQEILSVFPRERILTPDDVRGSAPTLRAAVEGKGWPSVDSQRGKVAFLLDNEGDLRDLYLTRSPILEGCLLFASVPRDHSAAAWMKRNDPVRGFDEISQLVKAGFLVRTRADAGTVEARSNDTSRRDLAIASGAQLISTDYPEPDLRFSDYCVQLPPPQ